MQVDCYYNLHKKCFSIRYKGKVIHHANAVYLRDAQFLVNQNGRQRVIERRRKEVHAVVRGEWVSSYNMSGFERGYYNPYVNETFVDAGGSPLLSANEVLLEDKKIYWRN